MYILLIIWFIFLFVYIIFNVYGLYRVISMRIKGDITLLATLIYVIAMAVIIFISISIMGTLDWGTDISKLNQILR